MDDATLNNRARALILGQAWGDALGAPTELMSRDDIKARWPDGVRWFTHNPDNPVGRWIAAGEYTGGTALSIRTVRALGDAGWDPDTSNVGRAVCDWAVDAHVGERGLLGRATRRAVDAMRANAAETQLREITGEATSDGAAMRSPMLGALIPAEWTPGEAERYVARVFHATHSSQPAIAGAAGVAVMARGLLHGATWVQALTAARDAAMAAEHDETLTVIQGAPPVSRRITLAWRLAHRFPPREWSRRETEEFGDTVYTRLGGCGTSVWDAVPAAVACAVFARTPSRCAPLTATLGGDTDTIGAIAVALCAAKHGLGAIPCDVRETLETVDELDSAGLTAMLAEGRRTLATR